MPAEAAVRVLLVEDQPADAKLVALALEADPRTPFALRRVGRLSEAIASLASEPADVVLLDLGLPDSEGVPALRRLRAAASAPAVVVLSGSSEPERIRSALEAGAHGYEAKRLFPPGALGAALQRAVRARRLEAWAEGGPPLAEADRSALEAEPDGWALLDRATLLFENAAARRLRGELAGQPTGADGWPESPVHEIAPGHSVEILRRTGLGPERSRVLLRLVERTAEGERGAAPEATDEGLFDLEASRQLEELAGGDAAFLHGLAEAFGQEVAAQLPTLAVAFGPVPDLARARQVAHALKSASGQVGAVALARSLAALEAACAAGRTDEARTLAGAVRRLLPQVEAALRARFPAPPPAGPTPR